MVEDTHLPASAPPPSPPALSLRLALDASGAARLKREAAQLFAPTRRPTTRHLRQVFWDTADHRIGRAGLALGRQGAGRKPLQLLRDIRRAPLGGRIEARHDSPAAGEGFDLTRLAFVPGIDPQLAAALAAESLVPAFALDLGRTVWPAAEGESRLTVALETVALEAAAGRAQLLQLELALEAGPPDGLYALALRLAPPLGAALAARDPIQEGYALASGEDWWAPGPAALSPAMSVRDGVNAIGRAAAAEVRASCAPLHAGSDPEEIHQARVALRRLRSMLSVFGRLLPREPRRRLSRGLGEVASAIGHAREWDVLLAETLLPLAEAAGRDAGLETAIAAARRERDAAGQAVHPTVNEPQFLAISLELGRWFDAGLWPGFADDPTGAAALAALEGNLGDLAAALLRRRHRRLVAAAGGLAEADPVQLHALRIEAKKLRYTAEFLRPLYPARRVRPYLAALRQIQDLLGTAQDAAVARSLVPLIAPGTDPDSARAAGLVIGWSLAQATVARRQVAGAFDAFLAVKRFWKS